MTPKMCTSPTRRIGVVLLLKKTHSAQVIISSVQIENIASIAALYNLHIHGDQ
jgi:hypothetical protein